MTDLNQLVLGGPHNGQYVHWRGELVDYVGEEYRRVTIRLDDASANIYIHSSLTNTQALKLLQQEYLGI